MLVKILSTQLFYPLEIAQYWPLILQGFLDAIRRGQEQVLGDLSMTLCDPFAVNFLASAAMKIMNHLVIFINDSETPQFFSPVRKVAQSLPKNQKQLRLLGSLTVGSATEP